MEAKRLTDLANNSTDVKHAPASSVTTTGISSVHTNSPALELSDDELVTLKLKDKNTKNDFTPMITLPKVKVNKNNFKECMK